MPSIHWPIDNHTQYHNRTITKNIPKPSLYDFSHKYTNKISPTKGSQTSSTHLNNLNNHYKPPFNPSHSKMATVTQASFPTLRPCASRSAFLSGSFGKLNRTLAVKPATSSSVSFKVEAKKGEWLPGLASPSYLDGRYFFTRKIRLRFAHFSLEYIE